LPFENYLRLNKRLLLKASKPTITFLFIESYDLWKNLMLTIMIHAKIKRDKLQEYISLIKFLSQKTTKKGCQFYAFHQNQADPTDFVLYEQWENQAALDDHFKELLEILGPAKPGYPVPEKLMDMYESANPVFYDIVN